MTTRHASFRCRAIAGLLAVVLISAWHQSSETLSKFLEKSARHQALRPREGAELAAVTGGLEESLTGVPHAGAEERQREQSRLEVIRELAKRAQAAVGDRWPNVGRTIRGTAVSFAPTRAMNVQRLTRWIYDDPIVIPWVVEALAQVFATDDRHLAVRRDALFGLTESLIMGGQELPADARAVVERALRMALNDPQSVIREEAAVSLTSLTLNGFKELASRIVLAKVDGWLDTLTDGSLNSLYVVYADDGARSELGPLDAWFRDGRTLRRFLGYVTLLRKAIRYRDHLLLARGTPLEHPPVFAFPYEGVTIHMDVESFRRVAVEVPNPDDPGTPRFFELKFPGEDEDRDVIQKTEWSVPRELWRPGVPMARPVAMVTALGAFQRYGVEREYDDPDQPLRIVVTEYQDGNRLRTLLGDSVHFEQMAASLGLSVGDLYLRLFDQTVKIAVWILRNGWVGSNDENTDWHDENLLVAPDGRVFIKDFGAYQKVEGRLDARRIIAHVRTLLERIGAPPTNALIVLCMRAYTLKATQIWSTAGVPLPRVAPSGPGEPSLLQLAMENGAWLRVAPWEDRMLLGDFIAARGYEPFGSVSVRHDPSPGGLQTFRVRTGMRVAVARPPPDSNRIARHRAQQDVASAMQVAYPQPPLVYHQPLLVVSPEVVPHVVDLIPLAACRGWRVALELDDHARLNWAMMQLLDHLRRAGIHLGEYLIGRAYVRAWRAGHPDWPETRIETRADALRLLELPAEENQWPEAQRRALEAIRAFFAIVYDAAGVEEPAWLEPTPAALGRAA